LFEKKKKRDRLRSVSANPYLGAKEKYILQSFFQKKKKNSTILLIEYIYSHPETPSEIISKRGTLQTGPTIYVSFLNTNYHEKPIFSFFFFQFHSLNMDLSKFVLNHPKLKK